MSPPGGPQAGPGRARTGPVTTRAWCVLAPNPGPMTLEGTNTWVLAEPSAGEAVVVDPGPRDEGHLRAVAAAVAAGGRRVGLTLLTHGHADHAEGAARFAELTRAPVRALDPAHRLGEEGLGEGDVVAVGGLELRVLATPGHTGDSLSFVLAADGALLTGDTVLGRGTTVVAHPDGRLADYLDSLRRLRDLAAGTTGTSGTTGTTGTSGTTGGALSRVLPGHGPPLDDALGVLEHYLRHRRERLGQVEAAVAAGARTAADVVRRVYADVDPVLWPAAELSVRAQLDYLRARGVGSP